MKWLAMAQNTQTGRTSSSKGYTLIELIIVMAIISILLMSTVTALYVLEIGRASCRERV